MTSGSELRFHRVGRDSSPIYQNVWDHHHHHQRGGVAAPKAPPSATARLVSPHRTPSTRRLSSTEATGSGGGGYSPHHRDNKTLSSSLAANPNSRHSMDVGVTCRDALLLQQAENASCSPLQHGHQHGGSGGVLHHPAPDDSVIMSRIKKSLEQKEEFLRRPAAPPRSPPQQQQQHPTAKEFYSRAQKLSPPVWPPQPSSRVSRLPKSAEPCRGTGSTVVSPPDSGQPSANAASCKPKSKQFVNALGKIREDGGGKSAQAADPKQPASGGNNSGGACVLQVVSMMTQQFESGKIDDKTDFYRSELARLSSKHNVPNVAVRKMEYEQKLHSDKKQPAAPQPVQEVCGRDDLTAGCSSNYNIYYLFVINTGQAQLQ